jgi:hypothetical protein
MHTTSRYFAPRGDTPAMPQVGLDRQAPAGAGGRHLEEGMAGTSPRHPRVRCPRRPRNKPGMRLIAGRPTRPRAPIARQAVPRTGAMRDRGHTRPGREKAAPRAPPRSDPRPPGGSCPPARATSQKRPAGPPTAPCTRGRRQPPSRRARARRAPWPRPRRCSPASHRLHGCPPWVPGPPAPPSSAQAPVRGPRHAPAQWHGRPAAPPAGPSPVRAREASAARRSGLASAP